MIDVFNESRRHFQEQLIRETAYNHYKYSRDGIPYSITLSYVTEANFDFNSFVKHLRISDKIILLESNLCAIIFDGTTDEQGLKAAENLLSKVQNICFTKHLYMAVATVNPNDTEFQTVHDLFDLLSYAINHNMDNSVLERSQIIEND